MANLVLRHLNREVDTRAGVNRSRGRAPSDRENSFRSLQTTLRTRSAPSRTSLSIWSSGRGGTSLVSERGERGDLLDEHAEVRNHVGQRIVNLVGHARHEPLHRRQALGGRQAGLELPLLGDVAKARPTMTSARRCGRWRRSKTLPSLNSRTSSPSLSGRWSSSRTRASKPTGIAHWATRSAMPCSASCTVTSSDRCQRLLNLWFTRTTLPEQSVTNVPVGGRLERRPQKSDGIFQLSFRVRRAPPGATLASAGKSAPIGTAPRGFGAQVRAVPPLRRYGVHVHMRSAESNHSARGCTFPRSTRLGHGIRTGGSRRGDIPHFGGPWGTCRAPLAAC